eukprot:358729-Chlamydomonas_euryale.AAC.1
MHATRPRPVQHAPPMHATRPRPVQHEPPLHATPPCAHLVQRMHKTLLLALYEKALANAVAKRQHVGARDPRNLQRAKKHDGNVELALDLGLPGARGQAGVGGEADRRQGTVRRWRGSGQGRGCHAAEDVGLPGGRGRAEAEGRRRRGSGRGWHPAGPAVGELLHGMLRPLAMHALTSPANSPMTRAL